MGSSWRRTSRLPGPAPSRQLAGSGGKVGVSGPRGVQKACAVGTKLQQRRCPGAERAGHARAPAGGSDAASGEAERGFPCWGPGRGAAGSVGPVWPTCLSESPFGSACKSATRVSLKLSCVCTEGRRVGSLRGGPLGIAGRFGAAGTPSLEASQWI